MNFVWDAPFACSINIYDINNIINNNNHHNHNHNNNHNKADFYGLKKIPEENYIPPEYHILPDYALYGVKFLSYSLKKNSSDLAPGVWMK